MNVAKSLWKHILVHKKLYIVFIILIAALVFIFRPQTNLDLPTQKVRKGELEVNVLATGKIQADKSVDLIFQIPGLVTYVGAKEGDYVYKHQTIAAVDQRIVQKKLNEALLDYSKQRNIFEQEKDDQGAQSPQDAINDEIKKILENNQFDLDKAVVSVELEELARQKSFLTSPIEGILSRADIDIPGVVANSATTYTVVDPQSIIFEMDVDEADVGKLKEGQSVRITLDAFPNEQLIMEIISIDFVATPTETGGIAFTVKTNLPLDSNRAYRIGMGGDGEIIIDKREDVLIIPSISIIDDNWVFIKKESGFEKRKIKIGIQNDSDVEVTNGLEVDDEVVLQPDQVDELQINGRLF